MAMSPADAPHVPIRAAYEAIGRLDAEGLVSLCVPDVRFESRITAVEDATYDGHDGVRRYIRNLAEAFGAIDVDQSDLLTTGDRAVATNRFRARGRASGVEVEETFFVGARAAEGRLVWWGLFDTRAEALAAVGLTG